MAAVLQCRGATRKMAAMAAASQAMGLCASFASLSLQEPHKRLASASSSSTCGSALRYGALRVPVGRRAVVAAPVVRAAVAEATEAESPEMEERRTLEAWVKQQLPGGFAAARLVGTGRRKTAVARVVLVEGTGKIVINNRTAQVCASPSSTAPFGNSCSSGVLVMATLPYCNVLPILYRLVICFNVFEDCSLLQCVNHF